MDVSRYGTASEPELRAELVSKCDFLAAHHVSLAEAIADRERYYWPVYNGSDETTVSARSKEADHAVLAHSIKVLEIRAEINQYTVLVDLLRLLLGSDIRTPARGTFPPDASMTP